MDDEKIKFFIKLFLTIIVILIAYNLLSKKNQQSRFILPEISLDSEIVAINEKLLEAGYLQTISMDSCEYEASQKIYYYPIEENLDIYIQVEDSNDIKDDVERNVKSVGVSYKEEYIEQDIAEKLYTVILKANNPKLSELKIDKIIEFINEDLNKVDLGNGQYKTKEIEEMGLRCNKTSNPSAYSFYIIERLTK